MVVSRKQSSSKFMAKLNYYSPWNYHWQVQSVRPQVAPTHLLNCAVSSLKKTNHGLLSRKLLLNLRRSVLLYDTCRKAVRRNFRPSTVLMFWLVSGSSDSTTNRECTNPDSFLRRLFWSALNGIFFKKCQYMYLSTKIKETKILNTISKFWFSLLLGLVWSGGFLPIIQNRTKVVQS